MNTSQHAVVVARLHGFLVRRYLLWTALACLFGTLPAAAQGLTGALIGTVKDAQGAIVSGAVISLSSPAMIGGPVTTTTQREGAAALPGAAPRPLCARHRGARGLRRITKTDIQIGAGATIERMAVAEVAGLAESVVGRGQPVRGSMPETPDSRPASVRKISRTIPTRRASMFDSIRAAPGVSPTSPSSGTTTTVSAFGSGTNENQFLIDGTNFTCPCNGIARSEPGVDFIQEVQVQSVGASAEFGNVQGAVINVVTRQGGERFLYDAALLRTDGRSDRPAGAAADPGRAAADQRLRAGPLP